MEPRTPSSPPRQPAPLPAACPARISHRAGNPRLSRPQRERGLMLRYPGLWPLKGSRPRCSRTTTTQIRVFPTHPSHTRTLRHSTKILPSSGCTETSLPQIRKPWACTRTRWAWRATWARATTQRIPSPRLLHCSPLHPNHRRSATRST